MRALKFTWLLYAMIALYGIILGWFIYMGPYLTYIVRKDIAKDRTRIVVSLTTTPYRIDKIKPTLEAIRQQSIKADKIYLNIPYRLQRTNVEYVVPSWLHEYPDITIVRGDDYGPITKLLPTLQQEQDPQTIIITVDDDVWYPRHVVRDLVHFLLQKKHSAATPVHISFDLDADYKITALTHKYKHASQTKLVVGAAGVAYRRSFFADDFVTIFMAIPDICRLSDDLIISMYLSSHKIQIQQVARGSLHPLVVPFTYKELPYRFAADALSYAHGGFKANEEHYSSCLQELSKSGYAGLSAAWVL